MALAITSSCDAAQRKQNSQWNRNRVMKLIVLLPYIAPQMLANIQGSHWKDVINALPDNDLAFFLSKIGYGFQFVPTATILAIKFALNCMPNSMLAALIRSAITRLELKPKTSIAMALAYRNMANEDGSITRESIRGRPTTISSPVSA